MEKKEIYSKHLKRTVTYTFIEDRDSDLFLYFFDGAISTTKRNLLLVRFGPLIRL